MTGSRARTRLCGTAVACLLAAAACAPMPATGGAGGAPMSFSGRRDERVRVGSFSQVRAIAMSRRYVFAVGSGGVAIYDRLAERWLPPLTRDGGFTDQQVTTLAADPVEDALWLGVPGAVVMYRPLTEQLQRTTLIGVPDLIGFERGPSGLADGGVVVRSGGEWARISRVGMVTPLSRPPLTFVPGTRGSLPDLFAAHPSLRIQPAQWMRPANGVRSQQPFQITSAMAAPDRPSEVWVGTEGDGLFRTEPGLLQSTPMAYGLAEPGVGALAPAADGIWIGGVGASTMRGGLTFTTDDLQRWQWEEGTIAVPLAGRRTYALATRTDRVWMGTERGLVRVRIGDRGGARGADRADAVVQWTVLDGLPDDRVLALAPRGEGTWAGTPRGLVYVSDSAASRDVRTRGIGARLLENMAITALQFTGDTLWVGTTAGLLAIPTPGEGGALSRPMGDDPALRRPVRAIAAADSVLLVATDDAVLRVAPRGERAPQRIDALDPRQVGPVTRVAADARTFVVAGTDGVLLQSRASGAVRVLRVPTDLPGVVTDVVLVRDWCFLGTPQGLIRLRRSADGLVAF